MESDLLIELFTKPDKKTLFGQLDKGNSMLPKEMDKEMMWTTAMKTKATIRTVDDALYYVFVLLVACPGYLQYVTERSNKRAMELFIPKLREAFHELFQGKGKDGRNAESMQQKKYVSTIDFVMAMRSLYSHL